MNITKAVQRLAVDEEEWQAKRAAFREMTVVRSRAEGLEFCEEGEWFFVVHSAESETNESERESVLVTKKEKRNEKRNIGIVYRVSELLESTAERSTEKRGYQEKWRLADNCIETENAPSKEENTVDDDAEEEDAFVMIERVRKLIRFSNMEILEGGFDKKKNISHVALASMTSCTTKLSVLLHNLEYCTEPAGDCAGGASGMRESESGTTVSMFLPSLYFFEFGKSHPHHHVLIVRGWYKHAQEVRSSWPSDASVYECLLPESGGWGNGGVLVVIFRRHDVKSCADYHHRFSA
jgi:hypothetical protein